MPNSCTGRSTPETLGAVFRLIRKRQQNVEHLYCFVYVAVWLELQEGDDVDHINDRNVREYSEPDAKQGDDRAVWLRMTDRLAGHIDELIFEIVLAAEPAPSEESETGSTALELSLCNMHDDPTHAVALALADGLVGHPPRFPQWISPKFIRTLSGGSDWVPRRLALCFTPEAWYTGQSLPLAN